jgi:hypothetical protein
MLHNKLLHHLPILHSYLNKNNRRKTIHQDYQIAQKMESQRNVQQWIGGFLNLLSSPYFQKLKPIITTTDKHHALMNMVSLWIGATPC